MQRRNLAAIALLFVISAGFWSLRSPQPGDARSAPNAGCDAGTLPASPVCGGRRYSAPTEETAAPALSGAPASSIGERTDQTPPPPDWDIQGQWGFLFCQSISGNSAQGTVCNQAVDYLNPSLAGELEYSFVVTNEDLTTGNFAGEDNPFCGSCFTTFFTGTVHGSAVHINVESRDGHFASLDGTIVPAPNDGSLLGGRIMAGAGPIAGFINGTAANDTLVPGSGCNPSAYQAACAAGAPTYQWTQVGGNQLAIPLRNSLQFTAQPQTVVAGATLPPMKVSLATNDHVAAGRFNDRISLALAGNAPQSATLGGTTTVRLSNGVATFSDLTVSPTAQGYTLIATDLDFPALSATSNPFDVTPEREVLVITAQPHDEHLGSAMAEVDVAVQDDSGNAVTSAGGTVSLTIVSPGNAGALLGTVSQPLNGGIARFTDLQVTQPGNGYQLVAFDSDSTVPNATSLPFDVVKWKLAFVVQPPQQANLGQTLPPVAVQVQDSNGSPVVGATARVRLVLLNGPSSALLVSSQALAGVQPDPSTAIATFTDLKIVDAGEGYKLAANDDDMSVGVGFSQPFNVGGLTSLIGATQPGADEIGVQNTLGFAVGDYLAIDQGQPNAEFAVVSGFGSLKLNHPLHFAHQAGEPVLLLSTTSPDVTPPTCVATATPSSLWPPNHKQVSVTVAVQPTDTGGSGLIPGMALLSATGRRDAAALGGFAPSGTALTASGWVRADKDAAYTVTYQVLDRAGNSGSCSATITVPHDQGH